MSKPILRDFICPNCGKGTSHVGRNCLDCATSNPTTTRNG